MLLGNFLARKVLAKARLHGIQLGHGRPASSGVAGVMFNHKFFDEVGPFKDDAAASCFRGESAKIAEECRVAHGFKDLPAIADILGRKLDDRTRLDITSRIDMVTDSG